MGSFADTLDRAFTLTLDRLLEHLPNLVGALVLLGVGWLLARLLRLLTRRATGLLDTMILRSTGRAAWQLGRSGVVLGTVVYWVVLVFFVAAATQTLGLQTFTDWLARLLDHLPTLAAGLLIIVAGWMLSGFVAELVQAAATPLAAPQRTALARIAQGATLVVALLVGADQIGLKVTWIAILAVVIAGTVLSGVTLSVSLGARGFVANLIGAHYLGQSLRVGQRVRVGAHEGRVVDLTATSLVLETAEGRVMLPGRVYHDEAITLIARHGAASGHGPAADA